MAKYIKELTLIQSALKANKGKKNQHSGYMYRNAEDIMQAVKPLLEQYECNLNLSDEVKTTETNAIKKITSMSGDISYVSLPETRIYIVSTATITNKDGDSVSATAYAREPDVLAGMSAGQISGATSSYARKYALGSLFLVDDSKDLDDASITKGEADRVASEGKTNTGGDLSAAIEQIGRATTKEEIVVIWNANKHLDTAEKPLAKAISARRTELGL